MNSLSDFTQAVKSKAHQLGFSKVGVSPSHPTPQITNFFNWIDAGYHADMDYLARADTLAKRADPGLILPGCQRVIALAMPYHPPQAGMHEIPPGHGRVAAYARTRDYHEIIWDKLDQLTDFIQSQTHNEALVKSYVDTGPILERSFAAQAGIGFPGKNSCLIIPGTGSYLFLTAVLTDLALPIDPPFTRDLCGSCQRCIDACPTGCILPNRTIDAKRCISYLTIENKGVIPNHLKPYIGNWFFGCDICQMVCPHNQRKSTTAPNPDQPNPLGEPLLPEFINLLELISWDQQTLSNAFNGTALTRPKRRGLLRNAAVVLGNQGCREALPGLQSLRKQEPDPVIQDACDWAIVQIQEMT